MFVEKVYAACKATLIRIIFPAGIFETNPKIVPRGLFEVEKTVIARGREIVHRVATADEKEGLEDVLYALRAYRTAWDVAGGPQ